MSGVGDAAVATDSELKVLAGPNILIAGAPGKISGADQIKTEKALVAYAIKHL